MAEELTKVAEGSGGSVLRRGSIWGPGKVETTARGFSVVEFFEEGSNGGILGALEPREVFLLKYLVAAGREHVLSEELD
ncbi:hypothetical protein E2562_005500 [Oryza meyeriana var. granulata]|uniref:Uncharacterized protein n=1 Tax=Oryza meyeriana var. granulata TaxID=110450 RepID=A0A6G1DHC8_9ORYZ|nr:hypothetical protein E2562_005500 [Oryza meyeriana var. granulata]